MNLKSAKVWELNEKSGFLIHALLEKFCVSRDKNHGFGRGQQRGLQTREELSLKKGKQETIIFFYGVDGNGNSEEIVAKTAENW